MTQKDDETLLCAVRSNLINGAPPKSIGFQAMPKDLIELCFETPLTLFLASWEPWLNLETALAPQERDMTNVVPFRRRKAWSSSI
jgi:hypothetical protein